MANITDSISIRLPVETKKKYLELANENGISLGTQLRMTLVKSLKQK